MTGRAMLGSMATVDLATLPRQYEALTQRCGLLDCSGRGKLALTGTDAGEFLNGQVTNDVLALSPGEGCYAAFLTHKGKMLGDLRVLAVGHEPQMPADEPETPAAEGPWELLLDTERCALQALFDMIRRFKVGYQVELHKRTLESTLFSLIGPGVDEVIERAANGAPRPGEHNHLTARIDGTLVRLVRINAGIDVLCDAAGAPRVVEGLRDAGAEPVGEAAAEIVRVEHGRPRYGIDMDDTTIPQEAGLNERAVSFTKGCYVGQETVARLHYRGKPNRLLRGLLFSEPVPAGTVLRLGEREVGRVTSSVLSPRLGPIGLALTRVQASPGTVLSVGEHDTRATVVELPFAAQ
jgi:tRNA-modifying protein YgfZ